MSSGSCTLCDLAKFFKRHLLSSLEIRDFAPLPAEAPKAVNFAFRHLISVTAPSEVLSVFLSYPTEVVPMLKEAHFAITVTGPIHSTSYRRGGHWFPSYNDYRVWKYTKLVNHRLKKVWKQKRGNSLHHSS